MKIVTESELVDTICELAHILGPQWKFEHLHEDGYGLINAATIGLTNVNTEVSVKIWKQGAETRIEAHLEFRGEVAAEIFMREARDYRDLVEALCRGQWRRSGYSIQVTLAKDTFELPVWPEG